MLGRQGAVRLGHRRRRLADLGGDQRLEPICVQAHEKVRLQEPAADEAADPLRREVLVADDVPAVAADGIDGHLRQLCRPRVPEEDERLLLDLQVGGIDLHLGRPREPLDAVLAVDSPQSGLQGRRPRSPDEPVPLVHRAQHAVELDRPPLRRLRPVLGGPERVVGDEHLWTVAREPIPELIRPRALVELPAVAELRQADHPRDRRLAHLGRPRQYGEVKALEHVQRRRVRSCGHEHAGELERCADIGARARPDVLRDKGNLRRDSQQRR